jgi:FAD/FMN-containing dehydrogenase
VCWHGEAPIAVDLTQFGRTVWVPDDAERARHDVPARGETGRAAGLAMPTSVAELRAIVSTARGRLRLIPQGANTGLVGASVPSPDGDCVVLSLDGMRQPLLIDPNDGTAVIGAGVRLSQLNALAAVHGLELPVDLSADPSIGGMVATNTGGSRVLRHGPMRHHVLGLTAVAATEDSALFGEGRHLRKDARGMDLAQILIGSGGTLGIVTEVVVALTPLPARRESWWLSLSHIDDAVTLFDALSAMRPATLSAFELVSAAAMQRTLATEGSPRNPFGRSIPEGAILAEWSAPAEQWLDGLEEDVAAAFDVGLLDDGVRVESGDGWGLRHRVTEGLRQFGTVLGHDVSTPRPVLMHARRRAIEAVARLAPAAEMCDFGHVGDGGLHLNVLIPKSEPTPTEWLKTQIREAIYAAIAEFGGSYSAEHGLGPLNADRWLRESSNVERSLVSAAKRVIDPFGILGNQRHPYNLLQVRPFEVF